MCATRSRATHWWAAHTERQTPVAHGELYVKGLGIADPPILSSSPRNGSGTSMNADLSLVEQSVSSARPARSLQNVPVRPPISQSTHSFFCAFPRIFQKISISQRLRAGCSLDTEGIGRKSQEKEGSLFCSEVAVGEPKERLIFVLSSCVRLRLTNRGPVPQKPYRQEPFLVDKDRIGGSSIGPARALRAHCELRRIFSHAPQTRFLEIAGRLRDPAHSIACKHLPMPPPFPHLHFADLSVRKPFRRYRAPTKEKKCLQVMRIGYFFRDRMFRSPF